MGGPKIIAKCPHCGAQHVQLRLAGEANDVDGAWRIWCCQNQACSRLILLVYSNKDPEKVIQMYPAGVHDLPLDAGIPEIIRSEYREASACHDAGCYKASMTMGRRVLQRVLKEKGSQKRNLVEQIDEAEASGVLRSSFKELATEIRQYGNLGAHPDDDQLNNCNKESAELLMQFLAIIIHDLYEVPAQAAKLRARRTSPAVP